MEGNNVRNVSRFSMNCTRYVVRLFLYTIERVMDSDSIQITSINPVTSRRIEYSFTTSGFPQFRVSRITSDPTQDTITGVTFRLGFVDLIEYRESSICYFFDRYVC